MKKSQKTLIAVFLAFLILPSVLYPLCSGFIDTDNHENRTLASFPSVSDGIGHFPGDFDSFLNDHLPFKNQLKKLHSAINLTLFNTTSNPRVVVGEEDWLYYNNYDAENPIDDILGKSIYTEEDLETIRQNIIDASETLNTDGRQFILFVPSNKETIYSEHLPSYLRKEAVDHTRADLLYEYLEENGVDMVYPKEDLMAAKDLGQLYYKYDTHWNRLGGYIGFRSICSYMGIYIPNLSEYSFKTDGEYPKDLAELAGLGSVYNKDYEYHIDYRPDVTVTEENFGGYTVYRSDADNDITVLLVHDSYYESMIEYFTRTFTTVVSVTRNYSDLRGFQNLINEYDCDTVVMEVVERGSILLLHDRMPY